MELQENKKRTENKKCIVCQKESTLAKFECKHSCVCIECLTKVDYKLSGKIKIELTKEECPLCNQKLLPEKIFCDANKLSEHVISNKKNSDAVFKFVKRYLRILSKENMKSVIETIFDFYFQLSDETESVCLISSVQSEELIQITKDKNVVDYKINNALVCICRNGWDVPSSLGGSGVCYFGNLGMKPITLAIAIEAIEKNHNTIMTGPHESSEYFD